MKSKIRSYFALQKEIHQHFGYKEDWVTIPLAEELESYWFISGERYDDCYCHSSKPFTKELIDAGNEIFGGLIYTQRFLPKWVFRAADLTMICANTQCDGNRYLMIFDNEKECKDQELINQYVRTWHSEANVTNLEKATRPRF